MLSSAASVAVSAVPDCIPPPPVLRATGHIHGLARRDSHFNPCVIFCLCVDSIASENLRREKVACHISRVPALRLRSTLLVPGCCCASAGQNGPPRSRVVRTYGHGASSLFLSKSRNLEISKSLIYVVRYRRKWYAWRAFVRALSVARCLPTALPGCGYVTDPKRSRWRFAEVTTCSCFAHRCLAVGGLRVGQALREMYREQVRAARSMNKHSDVLARKTQEIERSNEVSDIPRE